MKLLLVTLYFPPAGGGGVQRPLKFATHLPALGIETHVLAPDDPKWVHEDNDLTLPTQKRSPVERRGANLEQILQEVPRQTVSESRRQTP